MRTGSYFDFLVVGRGGTVFLFGALLAVLFDDQRRLVVDFELGLVQLVEFLVVRLSKVINTVLIQIQD